MQGYSIWHSVIQVSSKSTVWANKYFPAPVSHDLAYGIAMLTKNKIKCHYEVTIMVYSPESPED